MSQLTAQHPLLASVERFIDKSDDPDWLNNLRKQGADQFTTLGLPTTNDEEWRQTNVSALGKTEFVLPKEADSDIDFDISSFDIPDLDAHKLVFIDGIFSKSLSNISNLPLGVYVKPLEQALEENGDIVGLHLGKHAKVEDDAFTALNTAYINNGAFIYVPENTKIDKPIHLLFASTSNSEVATVSYPRVLIIAQEHSEAHIIEQHVGKDGAVYFSNSVTEIVLEENAHVSHTFIERDSDAAFNISTLAIQQDKASDFHSHSILLGGKLIRNNINPVIVGENCHSLLNGLYIPVDGKHMDSHMRVHHTAPNCDSRQYYTGVLSGKSTGAFIGRIVVDKIAQKTDAVQSSRGLLLSDNAYLHNRPQLEIFADDVKCTHGATIGELDDQSLFYLESRGIPKEQARAMLITAFAGETIERIENEPVRNELEKLLAKRLDFIFNSE